MLNYKECSTEDFINAMKKQNADIKSISDSHLYILYTKFKADASVCFGAGTGYATGLGIISRNKAASYKEELQNRGVGVV